MILQVKLHCEKENLQNERKNAIILAFLTQTRILPMEFKREEALL